MQTPPQSRAPKTENRRESVVRRPLSIATDNGRRTTDKSRLPILRILVHIACWIPLIVLLWDFQHNHLTANPIQEATFRTGKTALILLTLSLLCTPLNFVFGIKQVVPLRRPLGLYAFFYVCIHLTIFALVDYGLDWELIKQAIVEKRYVLVGFSAFLLLLPLAITSTKGWQRRLGKRWKNLHKLVYLAAPLVIFHFLWLVKADIREPLAYGAAVAALLLLRLPRVRRTLTQLRYRIAGRGRRVVEVGVPTQSSPSD
jgi:methionine sulfoxide reductase heme-binding subunit